MVAVRFLYFFLHTRPRSILYNFLLFEMAMNFKNVYKGCCDILGGYSDLIIQKFVHKWRETTIKYVDLNSTLQSIFVQILRYIISAENIQGRKLFKGGNY